MTAVEIRHLLRRLRMWIRKREGRNLECGALHGAVSALEELLKVKEEQDARLQRGA